MAVGTVNVGQAGGLPLNVRFQTTEPVEKTGLWVKKDLTKAPPIYLLDYKERPFTVANNFSDTQNYNQATIELDDYYVFYASSSSGNGKLASFNKNTGELKLDSWAGSIGFDSSVRPFNLGNELYIPMTRKLMRYNYKNQTIEELPSSSRGARKHSAFFYNGFAYVFGEEIGFGFFVGKINLETKEVTELGRLTYVPTHNSVHFKDTPYVFFMNDAELRRFNLETQETNIINVDSSANRTTLRYATRDRKYLIGYDARDGIVKIFNLVEGLWIDTNFNQNFNEGQSDDMFVQFSSRYSSSQVRPSVTQYSQIKEFAEDILIINTFDSSSMQCKLISVEGDKNDKYTMGIASAELFLNGVSQEVEIYYGDEVNFNPINERVVLNGQ